MKHQTVQLESGKDVHSPLWETRILCPTNARSQRSPPIGGGPGVSCRGGGGPRPGGGCANMAGPGSGGGKGIRGGPGGGWCIGGMRAKAPGGRPRNSAPFLSHKESWVFGGWKPKAPRFTKGCLRNIDVSTISAPNSALNIALQHEDDRHATLPL